LPAVIRIAGERHLLEEAIAAGGLAFIESAQSRRKRRLNADAHEMETTYNLTVSEADGDEVPVQVRDLDEFLNANEQLLEKLMRSIPGCHCTIDFSWDVPTASAGQYNSFPAALLTRLGVLGIDLVVTVYATSEQAANQRMHDESPSRGF
jgi:hypothetical protein